MLEIYFQKRLTPFLIWKKLFVLKKQGINDTEKAHVIQTEEQLPVFSECLLNAYFKSLEVKELHSFLGPIFAKD